jgi:hypothetical protein
LKNGYRAPEMTEITSKVETKIEISWETVQHLLYASVATEKENTN